MTAVHRMGDRFGVAYSRFTNEPHGTFQVRTPRRDFVFVGAGGWVPRSARLEISCRTWRIGRLGTLVVWERVR